MTGIERLRGAAGFWRENRLDDIVEQIEREQGGNVSRMRVLAVVTEMERHVLGAEGMEDSPVARWARELRDALKSDTSDGRAAQSPSWHDHADAADVSFDAQNVTRDPAADTTVDAYDLLPQEDRDAITWVRAHGGLGAVMIERGKLWGIVSETCSRLGVERSGDLTANAQGIWRAIGRLESLLGDSVPRAAYERPDSWERLEEDASKSSCEYFEQSHGCGSCPKYPSSCGYDKARDLVRRARALAERDR